MKLLSGLLSITKRKSRIHFLRNDETASGYRFLWLFLLYCLCLNIQAENLNIAQDSTFFELEEIIIKSDNPKILKRGGSFGMDIGELNNMTRMMGEADAINYLKHLSGVAAGSSYGSGIMIDGFETFQSIYRINRVPVLFPYRFGGIFSVFNTNHFKEINFERSFHDASMPNRLGAKLDFLTNQKISEKPEGIINIGDLASSLSFTIPIKNKCQFTISGRFSYIDFLLDLLFKNSYDLSYNFKDLNLSFLWNIDSSNSLNIEGFTNTDHLKYNDPDFSMSDKLNWDNKLLSMTWKHDSENFSASNTLYYSGFHNGLEIEMPQMMIRCPSGLQNIGLSGDFSSTIKQYTSPLNYGYELNLYRELPQFIEISDEYGATAPSSESSHSLEARIYGNYRFDLTRQFKINTGISLSHFNNFHSGYRNFGIDPRLTFIFLTNNGSFNFHIGSYTQNIHQAGFSQIGLASDFWLTATKKLPAQKSYNFDLDFTGIYCNITYSASCYWRFITSQPEYFGQILNLLQPDYNALDYIRDYNGYNCGFNLFAKYHDSHFNSSAGIGYGIARRFDKSIDSYIRGTTEPGITLNLDFYYSPNDHWKIGAQFKYATGRPYTPITAIYVIGGNIINEYGIPNSSSFPDYQQLDISATWTGTTHLKSYVLTHMVNFSLLNAYGHRNVEIMSYKYDMESGRIALKKIYSLYRFIPSISYTLIFK